MAVPAKVSKSAVTFEPDVYRKNAIASNSTLNAMVSSVLLVIARTARRACGHTHTHTHTHRTTTVTLAAHARRGLKMKDVRMAVPKTTETRCKDGSVQARCVIQRLHK